MRFISRYASRIFRFVVITSLKERNSLCKIADRLSFWNISQKQHKGKLLSKILFLSTTVTTFWRDKRNRLQVLPIHVVEAGFAPVGNGKEFCFQIFIA